MRKTLCLLVFTSLAFGGEIHQVSNNLMPIEAGIVKQSLASQTPSYQDEGGSGWWWCGHAAVATAINQLRQESVTQAEKIVQLDWIHERLKERETEYQVNNPHREASIDWLNKWMRDEKDDDFICAKYYNTDREKVKQAMFGKLDSNHYLVALSGITINGTTYGHFYVVFKIWFEPTHSQGGEAKVIDPYSGTIKNIGFKTLLDGMKDFGTQGLYSFLYIRNK